MKNIAIRITEVQAKRLEKNSKSLHAYARSAIDAWFGVREAAIKALRRKGFTDEHREIMRKLKPPRGAGRKELMVLTQDYAPLHSKLMMLNEVEARVLVDVIRTKQTRRLAYDG